MKRALVLLLLCLPLGADDTVHFKDGRQLSGKVIEYEKYVEVETSDGKLQRIEKDKILKIVYESRIIRCPEVVDLPSPDVRQGEWNFLGYQKVLVAVAKPPAGRILGLDITTGRKLWDLNIEGRDGAPVTVGRLLYTMKIDKVVDEKQKYKYQGATHSKEVHRLTLYCHDMTTGKEEWNLVFDNNDRKDLLWEHARGGAALHVVGSQVVLRVTKQGNPLDKSGNLDKSVSKTYVTVHVIDPEKRKKVTSYDTEDALKAAEVYFTEELFIFQMYLGVDKFRIHALSMKDGSPKWKSDEMSGRILAVAGDVIYTRDDTHAWAYALKTGKKIEKWSLEHGGAEIAAMDVNHLYVFRKNRSPKAILGYDIKKAQEAFKIDMPEKEDFTFRALMGRFLIYTDRQNAVLAYDTLAKRDAWKFAPKETGTPAEFTRVGTGLYFLKDSQIFLIDLATGLRVWAVPGEWTRLLPIGDGGILCGRRTGADLMRDRAVPAKAVFLSTTGTPLRYLTTESVFSRPAQSGDTVTVFGSGGSVWRIGLKEKNVLYTAKLTDNPVEEPPPPFSTADRWGVSMQSALHVFDAAQNRKAWQTPHFIVDKAAPFVFSGGHLILSTGSGVAKVDAATGKKLWQSEPMSSLMGFTTAGGVLWAIEPAKLYQIGADDGRTLKTYAVPEGASAPLVDGDVLMVAGLGFWIGRYDTDEKSWKWMVKAGNQDAKVAATFKGHAVAGGGITYFSSADGKVVALESKTGKELWHYDAREFTSHLLLVGDKLHFVGRDAGLITLNAKTGAVVSLQLMPDPAKWSPVVLEGKAWFWSSDGWMVEAD